jgi:hypothetical protein
MACFTDLDYRNKSYPLLLTIAARALQLNPNYPGVTSYGCFDAMWDAAKLYQFYQAFAYIVSEANGDPVVSENCFVQKTEDQQFVLLNDVIKDVLDLVIIPE